MTYPKSTVEGHLEVLRTSTDQSKQNAAAKALWTEAYKVDSQLEMFNHPGCVSTIVAGLKTMKLEALDCSVKALGNMAYVDKNAVKMLNDTTLIDGLKYVLLEGSSAAKSATCFVCGILSKAAPYAASTDTLTPIIQPLLDTIKNDASKNNPKKWGWSAKYANLTFLNISSCPLFVQLLKDKDILSLLSEIMKNYPDDFEGIKSTGTIANLYGKDERGVGHDLIQSCAAAINATVQVLDNTLNMKGGPSSNPYYYGVITLESSVRAIQLLSISDKNKAVLAGNALTVPLLVRTVNEYNEGLGGGKAGGGADDSLSPSLAVCAMAELSFLYQEDEDLHKMYPASLNLVSILQKFINKKKEMKIPGVRSSDDDLVANQANKAANLLLGRFDYEARQASEARREQEQADKEAAQANAKPAKKKVADKHVMLSYSWNENASPEFVKEFGERLGAKGVEVWRDEIGSSLVSKMQGSTDEIMAQAVENSAYVIVFCAQEYKDSSNCRQECQYARKYEKKGKVTLIYVMMQQDYDADGWLGIYLGDNLWYPLFSEDNLDATVDSVFQLMDDSVINGETKKRGLFSKVKKGAMKRAGLRRGSETKSAWSYPPLKTMTVDDVIKLFNEEFNLKDYDDLIRENDLHGSVLMDVDASDLAEAGFKTLHSKSIAKKIKKLVDDGC